MFEKSYLQPPQQQVHFIEDYVDMLVDDADKLLEEIGKKLGDEIINGYTHNRLSQPSLPPFHSNIEQKEK